MSKIRQTDEDKSEKNDDCDTEQLKRLTLNEKNEISEECKFTPTLDYLQVGTINGNVIS